VGNEKQIREDTVALDHGAIKCKRAAISMVLFHVIDEIIDESIV